MAVTFKPIRRVVKRKFRVNPKLVETIGDFIIDLLTETIKDKIFRTILIGLVTVTIRLAVSEDD